MFDRYAVALGVAILAATSPASAQDRVGAMVAVSGDEVFVGKPGAARGPAVVYHYAFVEGGWVLAGTLAPPGAADAGTRLSPSIRVARGAAHEAGARLIVGAGDPGVALGGHLFLAEGERAGWVHEASLALGVPGEAEEAEEPAGDPSGGSAVSLADIMQILQPPPRLVAADGDRAAVFVPGEGRVHLFESEGDEWTRRSDVSVPVAEPASASVVLAGDELLVGFGGAVRVFAEEDDGGDWTLRATLRPDSARASAAFGAALALTDDRLLVGAPDASDGAGLVFAYRRDGPEPTGEWSLEQVLDPGPDAQGHRFGAALAVWGDELWAGAPGGDQVRRFLADETGWTPAPLPETPTAPPGVQPGSRSGFGATLALGAGAAVVGAPEAHGGAGGATVFARQPGGEWGPGAWLAPHDPLSAVVGEEVRCEDGDAAGFACDDVDLMAYLPLSALGGAPGERVSDVWGWTDPATGREYALVGRTGGAAIVDVTAPAAPQYVGVVPANPSGARDLKVYADHLFFTGDGAGEHGLVVFDLTRLREAAAAPSGGAVSFEPDAVYRGIASAHNLVLDPESGFAFPVGASGGGETCGGGLHMVDVRDPKSPVFAGCFTDTEGLIYPGRTHDAQCVVYRGPDDRYRGRQLCFASNETALRIVDVTDKAAPVPIGTATYPGLAYVHQGWLTDDHRYYYLDDELDELAGTTPRTRTYIYDVAELDDPILAGAVDGPNGATDHNLYVKGDRMYQANYQAGFRLLDIADPESPKEIGWFDTTPYEGDPPGFVGAWTAYPFFDSGAVVVTSMYEGLFVLKPRERRLIP